MTAATLDKRAYDVLNVVALKKMASPGAIAEPTGLSSDDIASTLQGLADDGLLALVGESAMPTDASVPALKQAASEHYAECRKDGAVSDAADRFEPINKQFLGSMSAWQLVPMAGKQVPNDHADADYDAKVIDKIAKLVGRLDGVLEPLAEHDPRFTTYATRFEAALDRVDRGEVEFVSSPTIDSVHNIWFEFHEDLLRTLGRQREE